MKNQTAPKKYPDSTWYQITGECMAPLIRKGDVVLTIPASEVGPGDIVVIAGSSPAVHRVIKVSDNNHLITKGDNSLSIDLPITRDNLAGKVVAIVNKDGKPIYLQGRLWELKNHIMAKYSLACYSIWKLLSRNNTILHVHHRFSSLLTNIHFFVSNVITRFATTKSR